MNCEVLRAELALPQYAALTEREAAAALNVKDRDTLRPISSAELLAWSGQVGRFGRIEAATVDANLSAEIQTVARVAHRMICRDTTQLDLSLPDRMAMIDALVGAGVLIVDAEKEIDEKAELLAIATVKVSRAEQLGLGEIYEGHVQKARAQ